MSDEDMRVPMGHLIDGLGVTLVVGDSDDIVTDVLAIVKIVEPDGTVRLQLCSSNGLSWVEALGMLMAGQTIATESIRERRTT